MVLLKLFTNTISVRWQAGEKMNSHSSFILNDLKNRALGVCCHTLQRQAYVLNKP